MKRIVSVLLVFSILGSCIHLDELSKITNLIKHFNEHKASNSTYSFYAFFKEHYVAEHHAFIKNENKSHSQLPYKSNKSNKDTIDLFAVFNSKQETIIVANQQQRTCKKTGFIIRGYFKIWQPPKLA